MKRRLTLATMMLGLCAIVAGAAYRAENQRTQENATTTSQGTLTPMDSMAPVATDLVDGSERPLDVPYVPTPEEVVEQMLNLANVQKSDVVYDLGCGDGRIVITAARKYGVRGVGVDIDPERIRESRENARTAGVQDRVQFLQQDLFKTDIKEASVLMLYLLPEINLRLRPELFRQLKPGTRIASHSFDMGDWKPDQTVQVPAGGYARTVHYWVLPAHVGGTWQWNGAGAVGQNSLQLNQKFQEIDGTLNGAGQNTAIANATLDGDRISFTVGQTTYTGRVSGNIIKGSVKGGAGERNWEANRQAGDLPPIEGSAATTETA